MISMEYYIVITGASRGFGQSVAFAFLDLIATNDESDIVHNHNNNNRSENSATINPTCTTQHETKSDTGGIATTTTVTTDIETGAEKTTSNDEKHPDPTNDVTNMDASSTESSFNTSSTIIHFFLLAKDPIGLNQTRDTIMEKSTKIKKSKKFSNSMFDVSVSLFPESDLSNLHTLDRIIDNVLNEMTIKSSPNSSQNRYNNMQKWILINNAGTLGFVGDAVDGVIVHDEKRASTSHPLSASSTTFTLHDMQECIDLNVTSSCWFALRLTKHYTMLTMTSDTTKATTSNDKYNKNTTLDIVNISSLTAIQPFPTLAVYSACKAARDMYTKCLALEETEKCFEKDKLQNSSTIRFLSYAPGPLETDMTTTLRTTDGLSETLKPHYINKQLIEPIDSAMKLVQLLLQHDSTKEHINATESMQKIEYFNASFMSGDHIDYYDIP